MDGLGEAKSRGKAAGQAEEMISCKVSLIARGITSFVRHLLLFTEHRSIKVAASSFLEIKDFSDSVHCKNGAFPSGEMWD